MSGRTETFKYVRYADVLAYMACGWIESPYRLTGPHADHALLMQWLCECEPRLPNGGSSWTSSAPQHGLTNTRGTKL